MAVEGDHIFDPSEAQKMDLPFNQGWEGWIVVQGQEIILYSSQYEVAATSCYSLNNMEFINEAQH